MENIMNTTPADEVVSSTPANETAPALTPIPTDGDDVPGFLPKSYLSHGYYETSDKGVKYLRPEFVGEHALTMAKLLGDMKPAAFTGLIREMKHSRKKALSFEYRMTAAIEMLPKALLLVNRKKAPPLLLSFIKDNLDHIHDDDDWFAFLRHLEAIAAYLTAPELSKQAGIRDFIRQNGSK